MAEPNAPLKGEFPTQTADIGSGRTEDESIAVKFGAVGYRAALLFAALTLGGCASMKQGSTLAFYQGAILDVPGPGGDRLTIECAVDPVLRDYLQANGLPDYLYVAGLQDIELYYIGRDTLIHFHRSVAAGLSPDFNWRSTLAEVHPLPDAFLDLIPDVGARVRQARGE